MSPPKNSRERQPHGIGGGGFRHTEKGSGIECAASVRITARAISARVCGSVRPSVRITAMPESPTVTGYLTPPRRVCGSVRRVCGSLKGMPVDRVCGVCAPPIGGTPLTQAVPRFPSRALRWVDVERGAVAEQVRATAPGGFITVHAWHKRARVITDTAGCVRRSLPITLCARGVAMPRPQPWTTLCQ